MKSAQENSELFPGHNFNVTVHNSMGGNSSNLRQLRYILWKRNEKSLPKYLSPIPWKTFSRTSFAVITLWVYHIIHHRIRVITFSQQLCLISRHLQEARHDEAGWFLHFAHFLSTCYLVGLWRWRRHFSLSLGNSGVQTGKKSTNTWLSEDKSHPGAQSKRWGLERVWWLILYQLGWTAAPRHLLKCILRWKYFQMRSTFKSVDSE